MSKDRKGRQPSALALQQELNAVLFPKVAPGEETPLEANLFDMESIEPAIQDRDAPLRYAASATPRRLSNLKKSSMLWLWMVLVIAVIGGGSMAVYYFLMEEVSINVNTDRRNTDTGMVASGGSDGAVPDATAGMTTEKPDGGAGIREPMDAVPEAAKAFYNLGKELLAQQKIEKACAVFEKAVQKAQNFAIAYKALGSCYVQIGQIDQAKKNYKLYLQKAPRAEDAKIIEELLRSL